MLINIFKKYVNKNLLDLNLIFFILSWLFLWVSINAKPSQLFGNGMELLNGIRALIPSILTLPLIYLFLKRRKTNKFLVNSFSIENILFFLLIIYVFCKFFGGLHLFGEKNFLEFNYLTYSYLSMLLVIFNYVYYKDNQKFVIFVSLISFFFLLILTVFYSYISLKVYFINPEFLFTKWMYSIHPITNEFLGTPYARITGMSRIIAILSIFLFVLFLISSKPKLKVFLFILFNFFSLIIWMMQSRGTLICFVTTIIILIVFNNKLSILKRLFLIPILILIPTIMMELIFNYKLNYNLNEFNNKCILKIVSDIEKESICNTTYPLNYEIVEDYFKKEKPLYLEDQNTFKKKDNKINSKLLSNFKINNILETYPVNETNRLIQPHNHPTAGYTSGRIAIWERIFKLYDYNRVFGLGAQGDRQILMDQESTFILSSNASNLLIYSFISSGYFGVLSIFLICLILSLKIIKFFFGNNNLFNESNFLRIVGSSILIFLLIRSLVENSFGVFSIDALLFINAILLFFSRFNLMNKNISL